MSAAAPVADPAPRVLPWVEVDPRHIFAAGPHASQVDPNDESVLTRIAYDDPEMDSIVANQKHMGATHQRVPIVVEHSGEGAVGDVLETWRNGKKIAARLRLRKDHADAVANGQHLGFSAEIVRNGDAWNIRGTRGPVMKRLALLYDNQPRIKTLDSAHYADVPPVPWSEAKCVSASVVFSEEEDLMPNPDAVASAPPASPVATPAPADPKPPAPEPGAGLGDTMIPASVEGIVNFVAAHPELKDELLSAFGTSPAPVTAEEPKPDEDEKKPKPGELGEPDTEEDEKFLQEMSELRLANEESRVEIERLKREASASRAAHRRALLEQFSDKVRRKAGMAAVKPWLARAKKDVDRLGDVAIFDERGGDPVKTELDELLALVPQEAFGEPGALDQTDISELPRGEEQFDETRVRQKYLAGGGSEKGADRYVRTQLDAFLEAHPEKVEQYSETRERLLRKKGA